MPWLLNEDAALRRKLQGLSVKDGSMETPVGVRFSYPESELADQTFPLIVLERTRAVRDPRREARGVVQLGYAPEGYAPWPGMADGAASPYYTDNPIPYRIEYQVNVLCRKQAHLTDLVARLSSVDLLPVRFGYLEVPEDGTVRSLELEGPEFHIGWDEHQKRLLTAAYLVSVTSEVLGAVSTPTPVKTVITDLHDAQVP
ncbi:hypothetical protein ADL22_12405 [Streptomyces sp. NRRL F-4489]|uniref:hypothetical protein n=1 Tax=Streptomyces sp. NRRL F-4489 TaxID=1609095 RepID=UPI00074963DD|nr:hypothetical protein [Streptomyces sp. NRRL F-4489]KUL44739.1 hypothetical protein ADL22_12405 [Streptomyces sp. NRRL F-4489]